MPAWMSVRRKVGRRTDTDLPHRTFDVWTLLQERAAVLAEENADAFRAQPATGTADRQANAPAARMRRVIFWSHHLISPTKRRQFANWCPELQVWGLFKIGYPGFLVVEGAEDDVHEMCRRIKVRRRFDAGDAVARALDARRAFMDLYAGGRHA